MFYFDPMYLMIVGPFMLLGLFAQFKVKSTFAKYSKIRASSGVTGAQAAQRMLDTAGIRGTRIEQVSGFLSDHYDPRRYTSWMALSSSRRLRPWGAGRPCGR
jgi:Zn-dependent membrane protease YugP